MTTRIMGWATRRVGLYGRTVSERTVSAVASGLDCSWHTVYDAVNALGAMSLDDP